MGNQDEEFGMTVEAAMQLVRMMANELGLVEYKVPLSGGESAGKRKWGYLYLPREFKVTDAERMSAWIRAMVMEEFEPVVDREERLAQALARSVGISEDAAKAAIERVKIEGKEVIHAHPTAKSRGRTGCCGKRLKDIDGVGTLTTLDPKVVTCNVKPED